MSPWITNPFRGGVTSIDGTRYKVDKAGTRRRDPPRGEHGKAYLKRMKKIRTRARWGK